MINWDLLSREGVKFVRWGMLNPGDIETNDDLIGTFFVPRGFLRGLFLKF